MAFEGLSTLLKVYNNRWINRPIPNVAGARIRKFQPVAFPNSKAIAFVNVPANMGFKVELSNALRKREAPDMQFISWDEVEYPMCGTMRDKHVS